jgi:hypothetical protein
MLQPSSDVINDIVREASQLDPLEQQLLLTKLRVKCLKRKGVVKIATASRFRKPTLEQIDKWKHLSKSKRIEV